ncbi:cytosine permease [Erythrobacter sp. sf7]|uniref:Cytosine permease n=1 Tax=Erythrobacter fulvus TaxID=2987523 RepID=A0ABT5JTJ6_9SPHN|nr:cytosine permease [Erythrobacter fulvus]MDC8755730.1 cytosine permease [Erythrobacter fulvus]
MADNPQIEGALAETLPLLPEERSWSFRDMLAVKGGLAIATWGFLAGGATGQLVGFVDGMMALFFGTALGLGLLFFGLLLPVYRTGSESFVFMRSAFGPSGTSLLAVVLVVGIVPFNSAILSIMAGDATREVLIGLDFLAPGTAWPVAKATALGVLGLSCLLAARGSDTLRRFNLVVVPLLVLLSGGLLIAVLWQSGWQAVFSAQPPALPFDRATRLMLATELNIVVTISWFGLAGNIMRYGSSARGAMWGTWIGLVPVSLLPALAGLASSLVLGSPDPAQWMTPLVGPVIGLAMLLVLIFANISSLTGMLQGNVPTIVQNFGSRARRLGFAGNVTMLGIGAGLILLLASDALYARFYTMVAFSGAVLAPTTGILLADWLVLRRTTVDIRALHHPAPGSAYGFIAGFNPAAMIALLAGFVTYLALLEPVSQTPAAGFRYLSASLPSMWLAFVVHLALSRLITIPRRLGGYSSLPDAKTVTHDIEPAE